MFNISTLPVRQFAQNSEEIFLHCGSCFEAGILKQRRAKRPRLLSRASESRRAAGMAITGTSSPAIADSSIRQGPALSMEDSRLASDMKSPLPPLTPMEM